jgi:hypothetical protein
MNNVHLYQMFCSTWSFYRAKCSPLGPATQYSKGSSFWGKGLTKGVDKRKNERK